MNHAASQSVHASVWTPNSTILYHATSSSRYRAPLCSAQLERCFDRVFLLICMVHIHSGVQLNVTYRLSPRLSSLQCPMSSGMLMGVNIGLADSQLCIAASLLPQTVDFGVKLQPLQCKLLQNQGTTCFSA